MGKRTRLVGLCGALGVAIAAPASAQTARDIANRGACSTSGIEGLARQLAEAQSCMRPGQFVRFAPHAGISLSSSRVHPYMQASAKDALWAAAARTSLTINSAFRTLAEQYVLYASGGCSVVARPGSSNHQSGRAVDVQNHSSARSALTTNNCVWLGARDAVHFDCPGSDLRSDTILTFQKLWNVNNPTDRIAEDGNYGPATESRLARSPANGFPNNGCSAMMPPPTEPPPTEPPPTEPPPTMPPTTGGEAIGVVFQDTGSGLADTSMRLVGATVRVTETGASITTDAMGMFRFPLNAGRYTLEASMANFHTARVFCDVATTGQAWCSIGLPPSSAPPPTTPPTTPTPPPDMMTPPPAGSGVLQGVVYEGDITNRVPGVTVRVVETTEVRLSADGTGSFLFNLPPGHYNLEATGPGVQPAMRGCDIVTNMTTWCSIAIVRTDNSLEPTPNNEPIPNPGTNPFANADAGTAGPMTPTTPVLPSTCAAGTSPASALPLLLMAFLFRRRRT